MGLDLRLLPKVELHRHLEGSVRFGTWLDLAREAGFELPARDPRRLKRLVCFSRGDPRTLRSFLSKFVWRRNLYSSRESVERVAREAVEDAAREGVIHLELRFSPVHFARRMRVEPVECTAWIIASARRAAPAGMTLRFIITLARDFPVEDNAPSLEAAIAHRGEVVALDVAGHESRPLEPLRPLIRRGLEGGLALTVHAGEARGAESVREALSLGARRLGHGVRAAGDSRLLEEVHRRGVAFEMCLTSNLQTGAWRRPESHPLKRLLRQGHLVTLNTDDPAISATDLVREYRLARRLGLNDGELLRLGENALAASFLDGPGRADVAARMRA